MGSVLSLLSKYSSSSISGPYPLKNGYNEEDSKEGRVDIGDKIRFRV